MSLDKIRKLLNEDSDYANKRMEKATQSSKQSSLDVIRLRADQKGKALASSGKRDLCRGRAIDEYGKPLQKQVKLSDGPTPEKPGLYGGMQPSDRASTSDDSKSQYDMKMLDLMQMIMSEKQDIANKLEQANQKNQELTHKLKQVLREKEELAHQLKEVRLGEASSLQKGEASLQLINWEKITSWTKHYYVDKFAQTPAGEVWFDKYIDDWVFTRHGTNYMIKHA